NLLANAQHFGMCWPFTSETRWLVVAPLFHAAGSIAVLSTVWNAGEHVILPAFDAGRALALIEQHGITSTLVVPTMLAALSDEQLARPRDVSSLKYLSHGGAPVATETLLPHEEQILDVPQARSCGRPAVGVEVGIRGLDGVWQTADSIGEVVVRGPNVMAGYWNKPVETAAALVEGWYHTGDLGYQDGDGFVYLVDRAKDMIVTGGENVYSTEVEEAFYRHPAVREAAVFGVPDARWGEAVYAVVVPRSAVEPAELMAHCRSLIAGYKIPKTIELREEPLPKSGAGK